MHIDKKALKHLHVATGGICPVLKPGVSPQSECEQCVNFVPEFYFVFSVNPGQNHHLPYCNLV